MILQVLADDCNLLQQKSCQGTQGKKKTANAREGKKIVGWYAIYLLIHI